MSNKIYACLLAVAFGAAGCFTVHQTPYPAVRLSHVDGNVRVAVEGFEATVTDFTPVYGTETVMVSDYDDRPRGPRGRRRGWGPTYFGTYMTETYIPTVRPTAAFVQRATEQLESAGCILRATPAAYSIRVDFNGPYDSENAGWKRFGVDAGTVLFALYDTATYSAAVKVYENATGKLVFHQAYEQEYSACGWSPIWIFGMMEYEKIYPSYIQTWCLNALVDRSMADVSSFLAQHVRPAAPAPAPAVKK